MREKAEFRTAARCRSAAPIVPAPVPLGRAMCIGSSRALPMHIAPFFQYVPLQCIHTYIYSPVTATAPPARARTARVAHINMGGMHFATTYEYILHYVAFRQFH